MTESTDPAITDVYEFEGDEVTSFTAQIPSTKLEVEEQWPRGTIINLTTSLRVRSVRIEEDRHGNLTRHHVMVLEEAQITNAITPAQRRAQHDAAVAAQEKVIAEEPGHEDAEPSVAQADDPVQAPDATEEIHNELSPGGVMEETSHPADGTMSPEISNADDESDWSDVDAKDAEKRGDMTVESVEQTQHADSDQYEDVNF